MPKQKLLIVFLFAFMILSSSCEKLLNPTPNPTEPSESTYKDFEDRGLIQNPELDEASGLVYSNVNPGYLWSFNDSNNPNKIFLFDSQAKGIYNFTLGNTPNRDWEAMGICKESDGTSYLYLADIGDNFVMYGNYFIYWFKEPTLDLNQANRTITGISKLQFSLPDGSKRDMETMLIDQKTKDIFIISKREDQKKLYKIPGDKLIDGNVVVAEFVKDINFSNPFSTYDQVKTYFFITDANISPDNSEILVRNYGEIYYWKRKIGESIPDALERQARVVPSHTKYSILSNGEGEPQGEGVSFSSTGDGYYTISESDGTNPSHLYFFKKK
jgi:hypothetical protein